MTNLDQERFTILARTLSPSAEAGMIAGWFAILRSLYSEPHRAYHTADHIANLLWRLDQQHEKWGGRRLEVETAIWFHDAIYEIGGLKGANEEASGTLCSMFMRTLGVPIEFKIRVLNAIEATKHDGSPRTSLSAADLMVDLDLAGFADKWEVFEEHNRQIRFEFKQYGDEQYRRGRLAFLASLLARERIYTLLTDMEQPARENIERHMADLLAARR